MKLMAIPHLHTTATTLFEGSERRSAMMETAAQRNTAIRPRLLAAATGTFVLLLAALAALSAGVAPALPLSAGVGVLGAAAFATAILAMGGRQVRARRSRAGAAAP